jgi:hypothetical protein
MAQVVDWDVERRYILALLYLANENADVTQMTNATPPLGLMEKLDFIDAVACPQGLQTALDLSTGALKGMTSLFVEAQKAAAIVTIAAPSPGQLEQVQGDLNNISLLVQHDQAWSALSGFFADAANSLGTLKNS